MYVWGLGKKNTRTIQTVKNKRKTTESEIFWSISICSSIFSDFILSYQFLFSSFLLSPLLFSSQSSSPSSPFLLFAIHFSFDISSLLISFSSHLFLFSSFPLFFSALSLSHLSSPVCSSNKHHERASRDRSQHDQIHTKPRKAIHHIPDYDLPNKKDMTNKTN